MIGDLFFAVFDLKSLVAGAILATLLFALLSFVCSNLRRFLTFAALLLLLAAVFALAGCDNRNEFSFALGHRPQQNVLRVRGTDGKSYEIQLNGDTPAEQLIAMQTALSNALVLEAELSKQEAAKVRHAASMRVFSQVVLLIAFLGVVAGFSYVLGCYAGRARP